jgi:hypothetical protein
MTIAPEGILISSMSFDLATPSHLQQLVFLSVRALSQAAGNDVAHGVTNNDKDKSSIAMDRYYKGREDCLNVVQMIESL